MKATVVGVLSGTEYAYLDGRRRIRIRIEGADQSFNTVTISEKVLGIAGLVLDDAIDVEFGCNAARIREERKAARSAQSGCAS